MDEIFAEIELLHRETMDMLNRMAWAVEDTLQELELTEWQTGFQEVVDGHSE